MHANYSRYLGKEQSNNFSGFFLLKAIKFLIHIIKRLKYNIQEWVSVKERVLILKNLMKKARSYDEWINYAKEIDIITGMEDWKKTKETHLYDYKEIEKLIETLRFKQETSDINGIVHYLRSNLVKNIYSTSNPVLYHYSTFGTKYQIQEFQDEILKAFDFIVNFNENIFPLNKKIEFFSESRHAYGKTALILSGGGSLGMYHLGVVKTLIEQNLLPKIICGTSAGSIVAGYICTIESKYMLKRIEEDIKNHPYEIKDRNYSIMRKILRYFTQEALFEVEVLKEFLRELIGDLTFQEAFDKTGYILNIAVTGYKTHDNDRLLNYLTSPNVLIWSACSASSAIPRVFDPVELYCKNEFGQIVPYSSNRNLFIDGSLKLDIPKEKLTELYNTNTFIVSMTNPLVIPFMDTEDGGGAFGSKKQSIWKFVKNFIGSELKHRCKQLISLQILPSSVSKALALITQNYRGNVNIFPVPSIFELTGVLLNPNKESLERNKIIGGRRTYPKISKIQEIVRIELGLEHNYKKLKNRLKERESRSKIEEFEKKKILENQDPNQKTKIEGLCNIYDEFNEDVSESEDLDKICEKYEKFEFYRMKVNDIGHSKVSLNTSFSIPRANKDLSF